jgi:hypothetical protein
MARPKLGDSESKRLQMVITENELSEIEDWQFANRIPSKSEAIRRLCQIAIHLDPMIDTLIQRWGDVQTADGDVRDSVIAILKSSSDIGIQEVSKYHDEIKLHSVAAMELLIHANEMEAVRDALRSGTDVSDSLAILHQQMRAMKVSGEQYRDALRGAAERDKK